jgi:hypothetical protein
MNLIPEKKVKLTLDWINDLVRMCLMRRIVCAACLYSDGILIIGPRHGDKVMQSQYGEYIEKMCDDTIKVKQGFIDQWGLFLDRRQAWLVANRQLQIIHRFGDYRDEWHTLFSENLY